MNARRVATTLAAAMCAAALMVPVGATAQPNASTKDVVQGQRSPDLQVRLTPAQGRAIQDAYRRFGYALKIAHRQFQGAIALAVQERAAAWDGAYAAYVGKLAAARTNDERRVAVNTFRATVRGTAKKQQAQIRAARLARDQAVNLARMRLKRSLAEAKSPANR